MYSVTLAQVAYRNGDLRRKEFQEYMEQAEKVALKDYEDVTVPEVDASVERLGRDYFEVMKRPTTCFQILEAFRMLISWQFPDPRT